MTERPAAGASPADGSRSAAAGRGRLLALPELTPHAARGLRRELITESTLPLAFALIEGGIGAVIAAKLFGASPFVITLLTAVPMFGNLTSVFWSRLASGRDKVRATVLLQLATLLAVAGMACAPLLDDGLGWFIVSFITARFLLTGIITVRSIVWSLNYPRHLRARATGRLQVLTSLGILASSVGAGLVLDRVPEWFPWIALGVCGVGCVGIIAFGGVRVPDDAAHRQSETDARADTRARSGAWAILREDAHYRRYQTGQFLAGSANMMIEAPLIYLVSVELGVGYSLSFLFSMVLPWGVGMLTLPLWAGYLDAHHVTRFRARQSILWVVSMALIWMGGMTASLWLIGLSRVVIGIARGGGGLAWQLGHNDFARPEQLASYMSAHVTLTGIRGLIAPFAGMALYQGVTLVPGVGLPALGAHTYLVATALAALSWWVFGRLDRDMHPDA